MNRARDKKVNVAVAVIICPGSASTEASTAHSSLVRYIFKFAIAQIVIKRIATEAGDVNILQAVVVIIGHGHAHAPAFSRQPGGFRYVSEMWVAIVLVCVLMRILVIKRNHQVAARAVMRHRRAVYGDDVEFSIVVAVNKGNPRSSIPRCTSCPEKRCANP